MSCRHPDPLELTLVHGPDVVRLCLAYNVLSVADYEDSTLVHIGIRQAMPQLRHYYGQKLYLLDRQSVVRTGDVVKVIVDLSVG